jgi:hypothetical protein
LIVEGATDEVPAVPAVAGSRKRRKLRCHDKLVTIFEGSFKKRARTGGWEYTVSALILEYQHEASGGHAACTREGQRVTQDLDRRTIMDCVSHHPGGWET